MEEDSFEDLVRDVWSREVRGGPIGRLAQKLKAVKGALKGWAMKVFPNIEVALKEASEGMEEVQSVIDQMGMSDDLYAREAEAKTRLLKVVDMYEKLWAKKARCSLGVDPDSSPGPDGFPGAFFKQCWEIVGEDFCPAVMAFFNDGKLLNGINNSFVTLIPKVEGAGSLDKFSPICMANFFCKVLSKIMVERLACLLPRLVSDEQGAFQKNFGSVEWWSSWVLWCGAWIVSRGPNLPNAFYSCSGGAVQGPEWSIEGGKTKALPGPRGVSVPSHLLFADDIFIFMNTIAKHVHCLRYFLLKYQEFSSQIFNLEKSKILRFNLEKSKIFFGKVSPHRKGFIVDLLNIPICSLPTRYLGVEIFKGIVKKDRILCLMDKIKARLQGWRGKLLSMAGRVELIRSVISGMPIHNFSVYWWHESVINTVERWMRNFLWLGDIDTVKKISVKWEEVCKPKARFVNEGGNLKKGYKSSSMLKGIAKMWHFVSEAESLMVGNGEDIYFWHDRWLDLLSIAELSPLPRSLFHNTSKVADFIWEGIDVAGVIPL
ncbi:uncharacterized protein LOC122062615 [Macadamia integrifolia]|uniref:uncharacterized protein LOC122062615 n=1 Tax=Macadamia integrifolia TaxID=60698 RepID=UPI001C4EA61C|nr:uncharacterized protein LOC122062615 [Macadamia integrifolia]